MDTVRIGRKVVPTLFMDILKGKDSLCWQHLIVILSYSVASICPPPSPQGPPPRYTPTRFTILRSQVTLPLSSHSDTIDIRTYFRKFFH